MEDTLRRAEASHRAHLLRYAQELEEKGASLEAMDLYLQLLQGFPESPEGAGARGKLLALAQRWEAQGRVYSALHLLKRLGEVLQSGEG